VTDPGVIDIPAYLEAKFPLDSASLNRRVWRRFRRRLEALPDPRLLDLGTGTGAMLRRCLAMHLKGAPRLVGIDNDELSLGLARRRFETLQAEPRAPRAPRTQSIPAPAVRILRLDLLGAALHPQRRSKSARPPFDCITAHALMDLLPLEPVLAWVRTLLRPGGLFYASLNYQGSTRFFPAYLDPAFEAALLTEYDRSMEERRAAGLATGGSRSGSRLCAALKKQGFHILARGRSDWRVRLDRTGRRGGEEELLCETLLTMIYRELLESRAMPGREDRLASWYLSRLQAVREHRLGLRVRHLDILAARPACR
jgi:SAM-dependent methyltransferase